MVQLVFWSAVRVLWAAAAIAAMSSTILTGLATAPNWRSGADPLGALLPAALLAFLAGAPWVLADQWLHQQARNARAQKTYKAARAGAQRMNAPLVLYLRSFDWDEKFGSERVKRKLFAPLMLWFFINPLILLFFVLVRLYDRLGGRLESLLYRAASQAVPNLVDVSLGNWYGARGFGRVSTTDAKWQETASTLLDRAELVLMMFSDTTGTSWELEQLAATGRLEHTIFIIPPAYALQHNDDLRKYQLERDYRVFCERLGALGYATPAYQQALAFRIDRDPARVSLLCFQDDFDTGNAKQLRVWLREQVVALGVKSSARRFPPAAARIAAAALLGAPIGYHWMQQSAELDRQADLVAAQNEQLWDHCSSPEGTLAVDAIVAACSAIIESATAGDPLHALNNRGLAYFSAGEAALATVDFTRAIELNPYDPNLFYNRALAREAQGDIDGAYDDFSQVIALGAESSVLSEAHSLRGSILADRGDNAAAIQDQDAALRLAPDSASAYVLRADARYNMGDYAAVIADCNSALRLDPARTTALIFRALAYLAMGEDAAALQDLDRIVAVAPNDASSRSLRGDVLIRMGRVAEGEADLAAAAALRAQADAGSP